MQMYSTGLDKRCELLEYNRGYNRVKYVEQILGHIISKGIQVRC